MATNRHDGFLEEFGVPSREEQLSTHVIVGGRAGLVTVTGEIDISTHDRFRDSLSTCIAHGCRDIIIDMSDLRFIDSSGIGVLVGAMRNLETLGGRLSVVNPSPNARKVLEISGFTKLIQVSGRFTGSD